MLSRTDGYEGGTRCADLVGNPPSNGTFRSARPWMWSSDTGRVAPQSVMSVAATGAIAA